MTARIFTITPAADGHTVRCDRCRAGHGYERMTTCEAWRDRHECGGVA